MPKNRIYSSLIWESLPHIGSQAQVGQAALVVNINQEHAFTVVSRESSPKMKGKCRFAHATFEVDHSNPFCHWSPDPSNVCRTDPDEMEASRIPYWPSFTFII